MSEEQCETQVVILELAWPSMVKTRNIAITVHFSEVKDHENKRNQALEQNNCFLLVPSNLHQGRVIESWFRGGNKLSLGWNLRLEWPSELFPWQQWFNKVRFSNYPHDPDPHQSQNKETKFTAPSAGKQKRLTSKKKFLQVNISNMRRNSLK